MPAKENEFTKEQLKAMGREMNKENLKRHEEKAQKLADYQEKHPGWTPTPKAKTREEGLAMNAENLKRHEEKAQKLADYQEKNPTWQKPMSASERLAQEAAQLQSEGSETEAEADGPEA